MSEQNGKSGMQTTTTPKRAKESLGVGEDSGAPVSPEYKANDNRFNGEIKGIQLAIADAAENSDP